MKNQVSITVKKPCAEKFESFMKTDKGGFCYSCEKEVIDFTSISSSELIDYLCQDSSNTCGRFKSSQLTEINTLDAPNYNLNFLSRGVAVISFSLLALCTVSNLNAQNNSLQTNVKTEINTHQNIPIEKGSTVLQYTVKGTVFDENNTPLAGASVVLKGTNEGVQTDFDGKFEFTKSLNEGDILVFSYLGYDTKEYKIKTSDSNTLDITIIFEASDIELMGEVVLNQAYTSKRSIFRKFADLFK